MPFRNMTRSYPTFLLFLYLSLLNLVLGNNSTVFQDEPNVHIPDGQYRLTSNTVGMARGKSAVFCKSKNMLKVTTFTAVILFAIALFTIAAFYIIPASRKVVGGNFFSTVNATAMLFRSSRYAYLVTLLTFPIGASLIVPAYHLVSWNNLCLVHSSDPVLWTVRNPSQQLLDQWEMDEHLYGKNIFILEYSKKLNKGDPLDKELKRTRIRLQKSFPQLHKKPHQIRPTFVVAKSVHGSESALYLEYIPERKHHQRIIRNLNFAVKKDERIILDSKRRDPWLFSSLK